MGWYRLLLQPLECFLSKMFFFMQWKKLLILHIGGENQIPITGVKKESPQISITIG